MKPDKENLDLAEKMQIDTWAYFNCLESNFAQLDQRRVEVQQAKLRLMESRMWLEQLEIDEWLRG